MDAKTLAAQIRAEIRTATKTEGDPLHGLKVSVRTSYASLMSAVDITARVDVDEMRRYGAWTDRARFISDRLHQLAAPALDWANSKTSFCSISFEGGLAPDPLPAGWGTDADIDAGTHCVLCRSPYRVTAAGPGRFDREFKECTGERCGYSTPGQFKDDAAEAEADEHDAELEERNAAELDDLAADRAAGIDRSAELATLLPCDDDAAEHAPHDGPCCGKGHGPMVQRAPISNEEAFVGAWYICPTTGCDVQYLALSAPFLAFMAERNAVAQQGQARPGARDGDLVAL